MSIDDPVAAQSGATQTWEYQVMPIDVSGWLNRTTSPESLAQVLNEIGAQGWELVAALTVETSGTTTQILALFKRRSR